MLAHEGKIGRLLGRLDPLACLRRTQAASGDSCKHLLVGPHNPADLRHRIAQKITVVTHELHRRIDLVGHACREAAYRLELLRLVQLRFELLLGGDVDTAATHDPALFPRRVSDETAYVS